MKILISPAKKMRSDPDTLAPEALPALLPETERLLAALRAMTPGELQALWRCSDAIAAQNLERLRDMDLRRRLTPALLSYVGLQYQYMAPGVLEQRQYDYLQTHLRILSGFYGVLRPFDGVTPYRLEMGARLKTEGARDLYAFWGDKLARALEPGDGPVVDLASREYSRAILDPLPASVRVIRCVFLSRKPGVQPGGGPPSAPGRPVGRLRLWQAPAGRPGCGAGRALQNGPGPDGPLDGGAGGHPGGGVTGVPGSGLPLLAGALPPRAVCIFEGG